MFYAIRLARIINKYDRLIKKLNYIELRDNYFNETTYDNIFKSQIRYKGREYYFKNKVSDLVYNDNKIEANVQGTSKYKVIVEYENNNKLTATCTCPYYKDDNYCKHIYAVIYKDKGSDNKSILIEELKYNNKTLTEFKNNIEELYNKYMKYLKDFNIECNIELLNKDIAYYNSNIDKLNNTYGIETTITLIDNMKRKFLFYKTNLIKVIEQACYNEMDNYHEKKNELRNKYESIKNKYINDEPDQAYENNEIINTTKEKKKTGYAYYDSLDEQTQENLEKEMKALELEDFEKNLVREGRYNPWNFASKCDRELNETDYYYDDID